MTKSFLFAVIVLLGLCSFTTTATTTHLSKSQELELFYNIFKDWISRFNRQYGIEEIAVRFMNWKENYDMVQQHNSQDLPWKLEMNDFGDMTPEEFSALHLGLNTDLDAAKKNDKKKNNNNNSNNNNTKKNTTSKNNSGYGNNNSSKKSNSSSNSSLPKSVDWRKEGAVTPVRNQGQCGGCYAFAAGGALESLYAIKYNKLIPLSVQQMVDCSKDYGNMGCDGGLMTNAFAYTAQYGIEPEEGYEYAAAVGECRQNPYRAVFRNSGHQEVTPNNSLALKEAVAQQPVTVGIEASSMTVQLYKNGVITTGCSTALDHAVMIVGYGSTSKGQEYWIVRNSWGVEWGLKGYMHIAMGSQNGGAGVCGINMMASYPTL